MLHDIYMSLRREFVEIFVVINHRSPSTIFACVFLPFFTNPRTWPHTCIHPFLWFLFHPFSLKSFSNYGPFLFHDQILITPSLAYRWNKTNWQFAKIYFFYLHIPHLLKSETIFIFPVCFLPPSLIDFYFFLFHALFSFINFSFSLLNNLSTIYFTLHVFQIFSSFSFIIFLLIIYFLLLPVFKFCSSSSNPPPSFSLLL